MHIEISFQARLVSRGLIEVSIGLRVIRKTAGYHIDVKIDAQILRIASFQPQRRSLWLDKIFLSERFFGVVVNVFERFAGHVLSPEET